MKQVLFVILFILSCSNDDKFVSMDEKNNTLLMTLYTYRMNGNCLRKESISDGKNKAHCSRLPLGICDNRYLLYTSKDKAYRASILNKFSNLSSKCTTFIATSKLLSEKISSVNDETTIKANNIFTSVETCESLDLKSDKPLLTYNDMDFILSDRGKFAEYLVSVINTVVITPPSFPGMPSTPTVPTLSKTDADECLKAGFKDFEIDIVNKINKGDSIKEITCEFGYNSLNDCPSKINIP